MVVLDLNMPGMSAPEIVQELGRQHPAVQVLVLSMEDRPKYIFEMLDAGAHGYILKTAGMDEIVHGIRTVAAGRPYLSCEIGLDALYRQREGGASPPAPAVVQKTAGLSKREIVVLQLIAEGLTNQEIADKLFASKRTIETHRQNIISKTQMKNTASLIRFAVSEGLVA